MMAVASERAVVLGNAAERVLEAALHVRSRALHVGGRLSVTSAQADRPRELLCHRLELFTRAGRAPAIAELLGSTS